MPCFAAAIKASHEQEIPIVSLPPERINVFLRVLSREGGRVRMTTSDGGKGSARRKIIVLDAAYASLSYVPTSKTRNDTTLFVKDIWEIRKGNDATPALRKSKLEQGSDFGLGVVTHDGSAMNLVFDDEDEQTLWEQSLAFLVRRCRAVLDEDPHRMRIMNLWLEADRNNDKRLSLSELAHLLDQMNIQMDRVAVRKQFHAVDEDGSGSLDYGEFCNFYEILVARPQLRPLFDRARSKTVPAGKAEQQPAAAAARERAESEATAQEGGNAAADAGLMHVDELQFFLKHVQGECVSEAVADALIATVGSAQPAATAAAASITDVAAPSSGTNSKSVLSFNDFTRFLLNPRRNGWYNPARLRHTSCDMAQPLAHYFVNTAHNPFLRDSQTATAASSAESLRAAISQGARFVELQVWDGANNDPVVYHRMPGPSTVALRFRDALAVVRDSGFAASLYPLILGLELGTSQGQTQLVARHLEATLGDLLLRAGDAANGAGSVFDNFTPAQLKNRVLVKWRCSPTASADLKDTFDVKNAGEPHFEPELADVAVFSGAPASAPHVTFTSHAEGAFGAKLASSSDTARLELMHSANTALRRVYPSGPKRSDSSNMNDPVKCWAAGVQCAAMNFQTFDEALCINAALFAQNKASGYVLKPALMRGQHQQQEQQHRRRALRLTVTVLMGEQLPKVPGGEGGKRDGDVIDPYVELVLTTPPHIGATSVPSAGAEHTTRDPAKESEAPPQRGASHRQTFRTRHIDDNGFNPYWNETAVFALPHTATAAQEEALLALSFVTLRVWDMEQVGGDRRIAESSVPLCALRLGYRAVPLRSCAAGDVEDLPFSSILCHFALDLDTT